MSFVEVVYKSSDEDADRNSNSSKYPDFKWVVVPVSM